MNDSPVSGPAETDGGEGRAVGAADVPHTIGKYRFVATLGHGGMAEVFLAVAMGPAGFNKLQVVKRLRPHLAEDPDVCAMFLAEARLSARLNHRNVVQTNEVDRVDGQYFMAMEYLDGQPLHRVVAEARRAGRPLPVEAISRILCDALAGLHYAHELRDYDGEPLGVVHRDVSPQNVFVTYDGQVKIVDFGIAKAARLAVETGVGVIKGKVAYMAPEQAFGEVDRRADVFSLGVVLWELLADRRLWRDMGDPEILVALVSDVPRLRDHKPDVDPEIARICDRALALDRDVRYPTAAAFRAELERAAPPCSAEALGAMVEGLFHEQRQEIRAALARQVDLLEQGEDGDLLDLDKSDHPSLRPPSLRPRRAPVTTGSPISEAPPSAETPPPSTIERRVDPPPEAAPPPRGGGRRAMVGSLVLSSVLALGAAAVVLIQRDRLQTSPPAQAAPSLPRAEAAPTAIVAPIGAPAGAYIQVHLGASPPDAKILVDGAALPANPFDGKFVKDGAAHRIQAEASGFASQSRIVVFDRDLAIDLPLSARPPAADARGMKPDPYQ